MGKKTELTPAYYSPMFFPLKALGPELFLQPHPTFRETWVFMTLPGTTGSLKEPLDRFILMSIHICITSSHHSGKLELFLLPLADSSVDCILRTSD